MFGIRIRGDTASHVWRANGRRYEVGIGNGIKENQTENVRDVT